jgi:CHASE2 domain-containing sensor protein
MTQANAQSQPLKNAEVPTPTASPPDEGAVRRRRHHLLLHLWIGLGILVLFTFFKIGLMHTAHGRWLAAQAYEWLHSIGPGNGPHQALPIVLVDIADLKPRKLEGREGESRPEFTPRRELGRLIEKLSSLRQSGNDCPVAVGFDLDFSPEADGFVSADSFRFFDLCLQAHSHGLPVALGVRRTETLGEAAWLGAAKYASLAASISRPKGPVRQMPFVYHFGESVRPLPSLSGALAPWYWRAHAGSAPHVPRWLKFVAEDLAEVTPLKDLSHFKFQTFYVDFTPRTELERTLVGFRQILDATPAELGARLKNKMVIVGDARSSESHDTAIIPGEPEPVSGVFVQACATYTLIRGHLYVLNHWFGLAVAVAMSLAAILFIHSICWRYSGHLEVAPTALQLLLTLALLGATVVLAWLLMALFRVLWLEVFSVIAILVAHALVETFVGSTNWSEAARGRRGLWLALIKGNQHSEENHE